MARSGVGDPSEGEKLAALRRFLLIVVVVGIVGIGIELLFIGHVDDSLQLVPMALLPAGLIALMWYGWRPSRRSARGVRLLMALFVASGVLGVGLHYKGNHEFELEMYPSMSGATLVRETLTGATPVLAPGSIVLLGLVGFAAVHEFSTEPQSSPEKTRKDAS
jgi:hypothetical protein